MDLIAVSVTRFASNFALLMGLAYVQSLVHRRVVSWPRRQQAYVLGVLFGITASLIILMTPPIVDDVRVDGRAILITLAGIFGGGPAAIISAVLASATRFLVGGANWYLGIIELVIAAGFGWWMHRSEYLGKTSPKIRVFFLTGVLFVAINLVFAVGHVDAIMQNGNWILILVGVSYYFIASVGVGYLVSRERERVFDESEALRTATRLTTVLQSVQAGVAVIDREGNVIEMNTTGIEFIGRPEHEIIGTRIGTSDWQYYREDGSPLPSDDRPGIRIIRDQAPINDAVLGVRTSPDSEITWLVANGRPTEEGAIMTFHDITELKRQREEIEQQRAFVESVTVSSPDIIYIFDIDKQENVYANMQISTALGYSPEEVVEMGDTFLTSLLHPDDTQRLAGLLARWNDADDDALLTVQYRMRHKNGRWHWFEARDRVYKRDETGRVIQIIGAARDVTERIEAQEALAESQRRLELAFDATRDAVWDWKPETDETFVTSRWYELMGGAGVKPTFASIRERLHPDDWNASWEQLAARLKGDDSPFEYTSRVKGDDDIWRWLTVRGRVVARSEEGRATRMLGSIRDVSATKRAEELVNRLHQAIEQSLDAVLLTDTDGRIQFCNRSAATVLSWRREELIGQSLDTIHPHDLQDRPWRNAVESNDNLDVMTSCRRANDETFPARMSVSMLHSPEGALNGLILVIHDRTSEQELEDQLRQAQKMEAVGRLAGGIAHDFNNILQAMQGYTEFALEEVDEDSPAADALRESARATKRATSLVSQLLTFSRRQALSIEPIDLNVLIGDAVNLLRRLLGDDVDVRIDLHPALPNILADSSQIEQVLINLCVNARDAMPDGGSITIATNVRTFSEEDVEANPWARPGNFVSLMIEDTGEGISPEHRERIFEPFFTTKPTGQGTGLGLASVYATVTRQDGFVRLDSSIGEGSSFTLYFPAITDGVDAKKHSDDASRETQFKGEGVILIAEDNDQVRQVAERVLQRTGYITHCACDGEEAIELVDRLGDTVSLALLDVVMPRRNGRAVYDHIRKTGRTYPVVFSSGYSYEVLEPGQIPEGDFDLLQKPYAVAELVQRVHRALRDHKAAQQ